MQCYWPLGKLLIDNWSDVSPLKELYKEEKNYNFMIGGDGTIFQGRGWHTFSDHYSSYGRIEYGKPEVEFYPFIGN